MISWIRSDIHVCPFDSWILPESLFPARKFHHFKQAALSKSQTFQVNCPKKNMCIAMLLLPERNFFQDRCIWYDKNSLSLWESWSLCFFLWSRVARGEDAWRRSRIIGRRKGVVMAEKMMKPQEMAKFSHTPPLWSLAGWMHRPAEIKSGIYWLSAPVRFLYIMTYCVLTSDVTMID